MQKILIISLFLLSLGGCTSSKEVNKDERQEKSENMDLIIDGLDDLIEDSEEVDSNY